MFRPRTLPAGLIAPCLPTSAPQPPTGELWLHEINHDGFTLQPAGERSDLARSAYRRGGSEASLAILHHRIICGESPNYASA